MAWRVTGASSQATSRQRAGPAQHVVQHVRGQPAGERVVLARVVAAQQGRRPSSPTSAPCPNRGRGDGTATPGGGQAAQRARPAVRPERDDHPQRAAAPAGPRGPATARRCRAPRRSACSPAGRSARWRPSGRRPAAGRRRRGPRSAWVASPTRCRLANSQSPLESPVKTRPVRLPPWAAGASPTIRIRGVGGAPAGDRPAPVGLVGERRPLLARDVLAPPHQPRAGAAHARPARRARPGRRWPRAGVRRRRCARPGSSAVAGSSGQPVPGGTGDANGSPVSGCGRWVARDDPAPASGVSGRFRHGLPANDQAIPSRMSDSETVRDATRVRARTRSTITNAGVDHVGAAGVQVGQRAPLLDGAADDRARSRRGRRRRSCDRAVDLVGQVRRQVEDGRAERGAGAGDADDRGRLGERRPRSRRGPRRRRARSRPARPRSAGRAGRAARAAGPSRRPSTGRPRTPSRSPSTTSVEPPPTSTTSTGAGGRSASPRIAPAKASAASSSPLEHLRRRPPAGPARRR